MHGMPAAAAAAARPMSPHAMFLAAARASSAAAPRAVPAAAAPRRALVEPSLDGMRDEVVPRREAAESERGRDTWKTFFAAHRPAPASASPRAAPAARRAAVAAVKAQQLVTVGEHAAAVESGHANATASGTRVSKCLGGANGTLCGDETVDPLAGEAVHVARDDAHRDPKEENIYTYFSARRPAPAPAADSPAGGRAMFKVGRRVRPFASATRLRRCAGGRLRARSLSAGRR